MAQVARTHTSASGDPLFTWRVLDAGTSRGGKRKCIRANRRSVLEKLEICTRPFHRGVVPLGHCTERSWKESGTLQLLHPDGVEVSGYHGGW